MSPTSSSQHYQDYRDYPIVISGQLTDRQRNVMIASALEGFKDYVELVDKYKVKPEEARQVLPNCAAVNLLMTWNLRSILNLCEQRCCNRNVEEMRIFANKMRQIVVDWVPGISWHIGPPCWTGACNQGKMQCKIGEWEEI